MGYPLLGLAPSKAKMGKLFISLMFFQVINDYIAKQCYSELC